MAHHSITSSEIYHTVGLVIKDMCRGVKYILLYLRSVGIRAIAVFPTFLKKPSKSIVRHVDTFAEHVERHIGNAIHQYLDPAITRDSEMATFTKIVIQDDASRLFAKTTYDNLKPTLAYVQHRIGLKQDFFISEMLSACAYRKAEIHISSEKYIYNNAASVLIQLMKQGIIRTHRSLNAYHSNDTNIQKTVEIAYFAHMLWLLLARDYEAKREHHLLYACCDLSAVIHNQIKDAKHDKNTLAQLLQTHAEIV